MRELRARRTLRNEALARVGAAMRMAESAGLRYGHRDGREQLFEFQAESMAETQRYLGNIAVRWGEALGPLNRLAEDQRARSGRRD